MRAVDRILGRGDAVAPGSAARPFGTSAADVAAAAAAAARAPGAGGVSGVTGAAGSASNMTTSTAPASSRDGSASRNSTQ